VVFFDYNGNGIRDEGEPPIPGAKVQVGSLTATTGPDGNYTIKGVPRGRQQVRLSAPGFRYISLSVEAFQPAERPVGITVEKDTHRDWGLMQGFLTLPFKCGTKYVQSIYVDLDPGPGVRDWSGGSFTKDGHLGIDYDMPEGQVIVAAAPGLVIEAEGGWPNNPKADRERYPELGLWEDGNRITIDHGTGLLTIYAHLNDVLVKVGQRVRRGEPIGLSGNTGVRTLGPHLHFQFGGFGQRRIDPYRNVNDPNSISWWTKDNDPQCLP
jgi:murein DD-endopeptidase MepM/ murein hydrolase activator NlpD